MSNRCERSSERATFECTMRSAEARFLPWLSSVGVEAVDVVALRGDVSTRRYFRVSSSSSRAFKSAIVAVYPEAEAHEVARFEVTTKLFEEAGLRVPRILACSSKQGLMLLEDFGDSTLFDLKNRAWPQLAGYFEQAVAIQTRLSAEPSGGFARANPPLDAKRLRLELTEAQSLFLDSPELVRSAADRGLLDQTLDDLCAGLAAEPLVPSHRDFMARNLMLPATETGLGVIDHQDACLAPRFYDLASLFNDSIFPAHRDEEQILNEVFRDRSSEAAYRRCAVQRALKATATFVKFAMLGSDSHLPLVLPTLARAAHHLERVREGRRLPRSFYDRWRDANSIALAVSQLLERDARLDSSAGHSRPQRR